MSKNTNILIFFVILLTAYFLSRFIVKEANVVVIGIILFFLVFFVSFFSPEVGLMFLIFSMLLSPEIKIASVPKREVVVRIDDLLIMSVFFGWVAQSVFVKKLEIVTTRLLMPIFMYTFIYFVSSVLGILEGRIQPLPVFFYILKYLEYFIIYFLVTNIVKSKQQIIVYIICFFITAVIVNIHGYSLIRTGERLYAPFDIPRAVIGGGEVKGGPEANTYGGYLIVVMSLALSLFCYSSGQSIYLLVLFLIFSLVPFAYTLSRSSYGAFVVMIVVTILFTERKKVFLIAGLLLGLVLSPILMPRAVETVQQRIQETFNRPTVTGEEFEFLGFRVRELSALMRVESWKEAFTKFMPKKPFLGHGVTGVGLMDAQIPLVVGEIGLIGVAVFLWLIYTIYKESLLVFINSKDNIFKGLSLSVMATLTALLVQSIGANTFIIVRIMEPFWFLCGLVMIARQLEEETPVS